ncbi:hypothetical protein BDB01DRAFT_837888 [Pilobolus umbonatus]|nr:hypothetical protein BDB01DRAFT_837888 [Pilobolus umbonatus]
MDITNNETFNSYISWELIKYMTQLYTIYPNKYSAYCLIAMASPQRLVISLTEREELYRYGSASLASIAISGTGGYITATTTLIYGTYAFHPAYFIGRVIPHLLSTLRPTAQHIFIRVYCA